MGKRPWTHNSGVVSLNPTRVTSKMPLVKNATVNHLMNSTSLEKTHSHISGLCYARNRVCNALLHEIKLLIFFV